MEIMVFRPLLTRFTQRTRAAADRFGMVHAIGAEADVPAQLRSSIVEQLPRLCVCRRFVVAPVMSVTSAGWSTNWHLWGRLSRTSMV